MNFLIIIPLQKNPVKALLPFFCFVLFFVLVYSGSIICRFFGMLPSASALYFIQSPFKNPSFRFLEEKIELFNL